MLKHSELATLCSDLYAGGTGFDHYADAGTDHGITWGLKRLPDEFVYVWRGSKSILDWAEDMLAAPDVFDHQAFGPVHAGFWLGVPEACALMLGLWDGTTPITIAGHSLGGARACLATGVFLQNKVGAAWMRRFCIGCPAPGFNQLTNYIQGVSAASYRNRVGWRVDAVTTLPPEPWKQSAPFTEVSQAPTGLGELDIPFGLHHAPLYVAGLQSKGL